MSAAAEVLKDAAFRAGITYYAWRGETMAKVLTPAGQRDPYPLYARLREQGPVIYNERFGAFMVTTHAAVFAAVRDPRLRVDNRLLESYQPDGAFHDYEMLLRMDPPDHTRIRRLVGRAFAPKAVAGWRPQVEKLATTLLDDVDPSGFDLVGDYAVPLTVRVICDLLGVPGNDWPQFRTWGDAMTRTLGIAVTQRDQRVARAASHELSAYLVDHIARRRADPGDDVLSTMIAAEEEGDRLSDRELLANTALLLLAGFETTVNLIGNGVIALLGHPDQWRLLVEEPAVTANAVDEVLRYDSPVQFTGRIVGEDMDLGGHAAPRAKEVLVLLAGANNDPDVFPDPRRLDVTRPNAAEHVAFSSGPHYCLGASLARLEGEVALRTLVDRFPALRTAGKPRRRPGDLLRGFESVPVSSR